MAKLSISLLLFGFFCLIYCTGQQHQQFSLESLLRRPQQLLEEQIPKYHAIVKDTIGSFLDQNRHNHHHNRNNHNEKRPGHSKPFPQPPQPKPESELSPAPLMVVDPNPQHLPPLIDVRNQNLPAVINLTPPKVMILDEPHCPPDTLGAQYRYFNQTSKCYQLGKNAPENPCGTNMQLYPFPFGSKIYGDCDCKVYVGCDYRPLVYFSEPGGAGAEGCYHTFDQGPCKSDEWLTLENQMTPKCMPRKCPENSILLEGNCYELGMQGNCKDGQILQYSDKSIPICSDGLIKTPSCGTSKSVISGAPALPCGPGQKKSGSGSCGTLTSFS